MKYTEDQFKRVLECFDVSARVAYLRGSSTFICMPLYDTLTNSLIEPCKSYCPVYGNGLIRECSVSHDAAYWQFAKEKFIIENEPEGSEEDIK